MKVNLFHNGYENGFKNGYKRGIIEALGHKTMCSCVNCKYKDRAAISSPCDECSHLRFNNHSKWEADNK